MGVVQALEPPGLPQNVEAEAALLGALMISNQLIDPIADALSHEHFHEPLHGRIFAAIVREHSAGRSVSPITLRPLFESDPSINQVGGIGYLAKLTGSGASIVGAKDFAWQIKDLALRRRLVDELRGVVDMARNSDVALTEVVSNGETALADASEDHEGELHITVGKAAARVVDQMREERHQGVRSGIVALDTVLGDIQPTDLIILAARPAMGKSATAISYALGAARRGHGVLYISHEMSADQIAERALADVCFDRDNRVPFSAITSGRVTIEEGRELARAALELEALPLTIIDVGSATVGSITRRVRRFKRRFEAQGQKLQLVIIDYLQLVRPDHREKDRYTAISEVSLGLKQMAKSQGLGVMALCQLSREVEKRSDKRPMLADLRDSGSIEQDADSVLFLLRPEYYLKKAEPSEADEEQHNLWRDALSKVAGLLEFICAKRRRGSEGIGRGMFYASYQAVR